MYFVSKTLGIKLVFVNYKTVTPKKGVVPVLHTECFLIELNLARFVTGFPNIVNRCIELYSVGGALIFFTAPRGRHESLVVWLRDSSGLSEEIYKQSLFISLKHKCKGTASCFSFCFSLIFTNSTHIWLNWFSMSFRFPFFINVSVPAAIQMYWNREIVFVLLVLAHVYIIYLIKLLLVIVFCFGFFLSNNRQKVMRSGMAKLYGFWLYCT